MPLINNSVQWQPTTSQRPLTNDLPGRSRGNLLNCAVPKSTVIYWISTLRYMYIQHIQWERGRRGEGRREEGGGGREEGGGRREEGGGGKGEGEKSCMYMYMCIYAHSVS